MNRAKDSLIRNLIDVLVKTLLQREHPDFIGKEILITYTLQAVQRIHPIIYQERMSEKLPYIVEGLKNNQMACIFRLLSADTRCWNWLKEENRIRIKELLGYIKTKVPFDNKSNFLLKRKDNELLKNIIDYKIFDVLNIVDIQLLLMEVFDKMDSFSKEKIIAQHPNPIFAEEAIKIYSEASSYNHSEILGNTVLIPIGSYFSSVQVKKLLDAIMNNNQIYNASGTPKVIKHFLDVTIVHLESSQKSWKALANFFTEEGHFDEDGRSWEMYDLWGYSSLKKTFQKYNII
ncbi:MAG: hypothetical protein KME57_11185 [Scytonema hyalinum WJT4-NPBG1]|nr:hypothetical protein [Scytonema hyalinum WJT4-NPBG1]